MDVTSTCGFTAVTVQDADRPLDVLTVITELPSLCASTLPFWNTFMVEYRLEDQVKSVSASDGVMVGVRYLRSPTFKLREGGNEIWVGCTASVSTLKS